MRTAAYVKMLIAGGTMCIGGPALIYYVTPTEEELFLRYNPELQRRSLENRQQKQDDFEAFTARLKKYSKSDKPIWAAWDADLEVKRQALVQQELERRKTTAAEAEAQRLEMKKSLQ